jgi:hypothetical protein
LSNFFSFTQLSAPTMRGFRACADLPRYFRDSYRLPDIATHHLNNFTGRVRVVDWSTARGCRRIDDPSRMKDAGVARRISNQKQSLDETLDGEGDVRRGHERRHLAEF